VCAYDPPPLCSLSLALHKNEALRDGTSRTVVRDYSVLGGVEEIIVAHSLLARLLDPLCPRIQRPLLPLGHIG
jgi:hypothetical protein